MPKINFGYDTDKIKKLIIKIIREIYPWEKYANLGLQVKPAQQDSDKYYKLFHFCCLVWRD